MWPSVSRTQLGGQFFLDTPFWSHKIGPSYYWTIPKWWSIVLCHIQMGMYPHPIKWYNSVWWIFSYTCHFGPLDVAQNYWSPFCDSWRVTYTYVLWVHSYQWGISYSTQYCKSVTLMFARLLMKSLIHAQKNMMIPWWNHQSISIPFRIPFRANYHIPVISSSRTFQVNLSQLMDNDPPLMALTCEKSLTCWP